MKTKLGALCHAPKHITPIGPGLDRQNIEKEVDAGECVMCDRERISIHGCAIFFHVDVFVFSLHIFLIILEPSFDLHLLEPLFHLIFLGILPSLQSGGRMNLETIYLWLIPTLALLGNHCRVDLK